MDWQELYSFASKQALLGLCFESIERLGKEYPEELLMNRMGKVQQIRRQNMKVNVVAVKLFSMLRENEFRCCVLKGQGILLFLLLLSMWCISCAGYVLVKYCF